MTLPAIPESIYAAAWRRWLQSGEDDCRPLLAQCLDAVWPDLYALAVASLPAAEPAPVALPDREAIVEAIWGKPGVPRGEAADAVLALLAETVTPWKPVEPGTIIKAGTRYRRICAAERVAAKDFAAGEGYSVDSRTVLDPDAALVEAIGSVLTHYEGGKWGPESVAILAAIRETHTIEPKPTTGPLGGAR